MTIRFDMEMEDLLAFQKHFYLTNKQLRRQSLTMRSIFFIGGVLFLWPASSIVSAGYPVWNPIPLILILCALLWFALGIFSPKLLQKINLSRAFNIFSKQESSDNFGTTIMEFDATGFTLERKGVVTQTSWIAVQKVDETKDYFFVYLSEIAANPIPKQKLTSTEVEELGSLFSKYVIDKKQK